VDPFGDEPIILKLLHLHGNFDFKATRAHEMDIRVMDRLAASPRVVSAYGFCGQSVLTQFAQALTSRAVKDNGLSWRERFIMALELTRGLAELHALRPIVFDNIMTKGFNESDPIALLHSLPTDKPQLFSHHDITIANTISLRPKQLQWNDFNLGILVQNRSNGTGECPVPIRYEGILWRSPEEIQNATGYLQTPFPSDVYAFGAVLFTILTKHQPWTHLEESKGNTTMEALARKKLRGDMPNLPLKYAPKRKEAKVLWAAVRACFRRDPQQRPTAYRLALSMEVALRWIQGRKELSSRTIEQLFSI
jgi:serine/threonine protein kinase